MVVSKDTELLVIALVINKAMLRPVAISIGKKPMIRWKNEFIASRLELSDDVSSQI
jgi:hypothetical protein